MRIITANLSRETKGTDLIFFIVIGCSFSHCVFKGRLYKITSSYTFDLSEATQAHRRTDNNLALGYQSCVRMY